ncbi:hypothetical protein BD779DRAFT_1669790 [Infundibulicybe gibba]|nr:hypothetical protein BD779DRAFT_1669790 [Infundibulicybe gibba]
MHAILGRIEKLIRPPQCIFALSCPTPWSQRWSTSLPELPLEVWLEIFEFATYVHRSATISPLDPFILTRVSNNVMGTNTLLLAMRTKLSLSLVSHAWRRAALRMLWEHVIILSPARACAILAVLQARPDDSAVGHNTHRGHGLSTRHIEIYTHARGAQHLSFLQTIFQILQCCPNLRTLSGTWCHTLPIEFLKGISKMYDHKLQELYWNQTGDHFSSNNPTFGPLEFIGGFRALRVLDIGSFVVHLAEHPKPSSAQNVSLPLVQNLIASTNSRSLGLAANISLPALRHLTLIASIGYPIPTNSLRSFLKVHGPSLVSVDMPSPPITMSTDVEPRLLHINPDTFLDPDVCPNLTTFTFPMTSPPIGPSVHPGIRRIGLRGISTRDYTLTN